MRSRSPAVTGRRLRYPYTDREIISSPQARVLRDPVLADQLLRLCSGLSLFEHPDDLFFGKSLRSYRPLPCRRTLLLSGTIRGGHLILAQGRWLGDGDAFARRADAGRDRHGGHDAASREFHGGRSYTGMEFGKAFSSRDEISTFAATRAVEQIQDFMANGGTFPGK